MRQSYSTNKKSSQFDEFMMLILQKTVMDRKSHTWAFAESMTIASSLSRDSAVSSLRFLISCVVTVCITWSELRISITIMRIRIRTTFLLQCGSGSCSPRCDENIWPLVYRQAPPELHVEPPRLHCERPFLKQWAPEFCLFNADPDPASQKYCGFMLSRTSESLQPWSGWPEWANIHQVRSKVP